ncbi:MAG: DNA gyrase C-terminal beta-propeller domain-containing protein [Acidimicrobiales bacterium]
MVRVVPTSGDDDLMMVTYRGMAIRFNEVEVREMGRDATGVRGIKLKPDDRAISLDVVRDDADLFVVTDTGFGKRVKTERFNRQGRGGQGVRAIKLTAARGFVVASFMVHLDDEVLLASSGGVLIRTPVREISSQGRDATGVRVMNLDEGHAVAAVAVVPFEQED